MSYGFFVRGTQGHLIIDDENPTLAQVERGDIVVTHSLPNTGRLAHWAVCNVVYKQVVRTQIPPFVFGVPTSAGPAGLAIGMFCHIGGPGNWTGFRLIVTASVRFEALDATTVGQRIGVGRHTGWEYRVCGFEAPPSSDGYGMRIWGPSGKLVFDSGWPLTPFRHLMRSWSLVESRKVNYLSLWNYIGNDEANHANDVDPVVHRYTHPWGYNDGDHGILLSGLNMLDARADLGWRSDSSLITLAPLVGFVSGDRTNISIGLGLGVLQHSDTNAPALNGWGLMTADFSKT